MPRSKSASKKRKVVSKSKKKNKNKVNKNIFIIAVAGIVLLIIIILIIVLVPKRMVCSGVNSYDLGIKQVNELTFKTFGKNVKSVNVVKTITINKEYKENESSYLQIIDESLKSSYEHKNIKYTSKIENGKLIVNLTYDDKKTYILDDVDIILNQEGVSVNVMTEDNNNSRITIDLSKDNNKSDVKNLAQNKNYKCN